jgi:serine/threonine protein phosphatase PrpC
VLTQALMGDGNVTPVLQIYDVKPNDRFIVCSDGLSSVLSDKEIKTLLKMKSADESITALIEATYINGAPDNVSIIIADVVNSNEASMLLIGAAQ